MGLCEEPDSNVEAVIETHHQVVQRLWTHTAVPNFDLRDNVVGVKLLPTSHQVLYKRVVVSEVMVKRAACTPTRSAQTVYRQTGCTRFNQLVKAQLEPILLA